MLHLTNKQKHFGKPACILEKSQIKNDQLFYFLTALIIIYFFIFKQVQKKSFKNSQGIKFYRFYFTAMPIIWQKTRCYRARSRMLRIFAYFKGK